MFTSRKLLRFLVFFLSMNCVISGGENRYELRFSNPEKLKLGDGEMLYDPFIEYGVSVTHLFRLLGEGKNAGGKGYSYSLEFSGEDFMQMIFKLERLKDGETMETTQGVTLKRVGNTARGVCRDFGGVVGTVQEFTFDYKESLNFLKEVRAKSTWLKNHFSSKDKKPLR